MLLGRLEIIRVTWLLLLGILSPLVVFSDSGDNIPDDLKKYIYDQYLKPDETYTAVAINQFKNTGPVRCTYFLPSRADYNEDKELLLSRDSFEDGIFDVYITAGPENQKIILKKTDPNKGVKRAFDYDLDELSKRIQIPDEFKKYLYLTEICETRFGAFVFYKLSHLSRLSSSVTMDIIDNEKRYYLHGFIIKKGQSFVVPHFNIEKLDPEVESYNRELWDIFDFQGKVILLISLVIYENHLFEVYSFNKNKVRLLYSFSFEGL